MNTSTAGGFGVLPRLLCCPVGCPAATAHDVPDDERQEQYRQRDQRVQGVLRDVVVDRADVVAGQVAEAHPGPHPQSGAECVEDQETPPVHAADAGDDSVGLAQALNEPRDHNNPRAVVIEEVFGFGQPFLGEEYVPAPSQGQRTAAEMPDGEADVVPDDGRDEAYETDQYDVEPARACEDRGGDENGLAGDGYAEVFERDQEQDRPVAVVLEVGCHDIEKARQIRWRAACQRGGDGGQHMRGHLSTRR